MKLERKLVALAFRRMARGVGLKAAYENSAGFYLARRVNQKTSAEF